MKAQPRAAPNKGGDESRLFHGLMRSAEFCAHEQNPSPRSAFALVSFKITTIHGKGEVAHMAQKFALNVNGKTHSVEADPDMPLLYALRDDIGLNNPKFGCGVAQCGACTVHMDGQAIRSCITPVSSVGDAKIVTLAGLGTPEKPHPLQTAYIEEQVPQCGYCINGWIMTAASFLATKKKPTDAEIKSALEGVKCRCGTHVSIVKAVKRAAEMMG